MHSGEEIRETRHPLVDFCAVLTHNLVSNLLPRQKNVQTAKKEKKEKKKKDSIEGENKSE